MATKIAVARQMPDAPGAKPLTVTAGAIEFATTSFQRSDCDEACQETDLDAITASGWRPPTQDEAATYVHRKRVDAWVVVRDDRGGVGWLAGSMTEQ